ncbi:MAG: alpha-L-fucosidase [Lentisphaeria bacterium]|nr:alpha-L-fucosidase [Lentisphaeria bacterium]
MTPVEFSELRYGMFVHFGVFSQLARGEWVMNREQISPAELELLAKDFHPERFNADELCRLAVDGGMKYIVFTTMHHEGFRMYSSELSDFNSWNYCGRDFVREIVDSARKHGLKIGLYHSLNNWHDAPDAVDALEDQEKYDIFIKKTFARLKELAERYKPFDIVWYDGWWPFNADGWQGEKMNAMLRKIHSDFIFNGRNCLPGDFGTPEQHLTPPSPWRPWEACVTLNSHWGYYEGDNRWKSPEDVIDMLLTCGSKRGNLLLNIGPRGDGSIPEKSSAIVRAVGQWLREGGWEAINAFDELTLSPAIPTPGERGDWDPHGRFTASGNDLYYVLMYPRKTLTIAGFIGKVQRITAYGIGELRFVQNGSKLKIDLPDELQGRLAPVLKMECDSPAGVYRTGGLRIANVEHPRYDPVPPDIRY